MISTTALVFAFTFSKLVAPQSIDPSSVDITTRDKWCDAQKASCPLLCLQIPGASAAPSSNDCTPSSLAFSCVCSNGQQPNASQYSQTIPYFECTESNTQCANNCGQNSACVSSCRTSHPCGAQDPVRVNTSTISTMAATSSATGRAAATSGGSAVYTGFGSSSTSSSKPDNSSKAQTIAIGIGRTYGLVLVLAGVFGGFTLML